MSRSRVRVPEHIPEELLKVGARIVETGMGGQHPFVRFELGGQVRKFGWPGTSSDWRAMRNNRTELRRLIRDLQAQIVKTRKVA